MVYLRKLIEEDLVSLWEIAYSQSNPIWKQYDAPYYDDYQHFPNFQEFKLQKSESTLNNSNRLGIFVDDKLVGTVSATRYVNKQDGWNWGFVFMITSFGTLALEKLLCYSG